MLERMPPIDIKDTTAPPMNQQDLEASAKKTSKLVPVPTSQVCSLISLSCLSLWKQPEQPSLLDITSSDVPVSMATVQPAGDNTLLDLLGMDL